jgi:hypothetical protein
MKAVAALFVLLTSSFAGAMTCSDGSGRSVTLAQGSLAFQGLGSKGLPSGANYSIILSGYTHVPGGPDYSDYTAENGGKEIFVRFSESGSKTSALIYLGSKPKGTPVATVDCIAN